MSETTGLNNNYREPILCKHCEHSVPHQGKLWCMRATAEGAVVPPSVSTFRITDNGTCDKASLADVPF